MTTISRSELKERFTDLSREMERHRIQVPRFHRVVLGLSVGPRAKHLVYSGMPSWESEVVESFPRERAWRVQPTTIQQSVNKIPDNRTVYLAFGEQKKRCHTTVQRVYFVDVYGGLRYASPTDFIYEVRFNNVKCWSGITDSGSNMIFGL